MSRTVLLGMLLAVLMSPLSAAVITVGPVACVHTSLAAAVAAAESGDTIRIHKDYDAPTNVLIEKSLTLVGGLDHCFTATPGVATASVLASADPAPGRVLDVRGSGVVVGLYHLHLTGGASVGGLNVQNGATVRVAGVEVDHSDALFGGGIMLHGGARLELVAAPFSSTRSGLNVHDNAAAQGGGIYIATGSVLERHADARWLSLWNNQALDLGANSGRGGGLFLQPGAQALLHESSVFGNTAVLGGGVYVSGRSVEQSLDEDPDLLLMGTLNLNTAIRGGGVYVAPSAAVRVQLGRLFQNYAGDAGGGLWFGSEGELSIERVEDNSSGGAGGGILQQAGYIRLRERLNLNTAQDDGGGWMATGGSRGLDGGIEISGNESLGGGGGALALIEAGETRIPSNQIDAGSCSEQTPCRIDANQAAGNGGALLLEGSTLVLYSVLGTDAHGLLVEGNRSALNGGAIRAINGSVLLLLNITHLLAEPGQASLWLDNSAGLYGGAISLRQSFMQISDAEFGSLDRPNQALFGGAIAVFARDTVASETDLRSFNLRFIGNRAGNVGGALAVVDGGRVRLDTTKCRAAELSANRYCSQFDGNQAGNGAAIAVIGGTLMARSTAFTGNSALDSDAATVTIDGDDSDSELENVLLAGNDAGGIALLDGGTPGTRLRMLSSTIANNSGDGIRLHALASIELDLENSLLWGNAGQAVAGLVDGASFSQDCSLIEGGVHGALNIDPHFVETARGSWRLPFDSPASRRCASGAFQDLDGNLRSAPHDIGALVAGGELPPLLFANGFEAD